MIHGDACFAYFNKIWGIPEPPLRGLFVLYAIFQGRKVQIASPLCYSRFAWYPLSLNYSPSNYRPSNYPPSSQGSACATPGVQYLQLSLPPFDHWGPNP